MALSNWDTFAVNEKGEPCKGTFKSPLGVEVSIYKNWIYVRDEKAWQEGGGFISPTIMEIYDANLHYKDVTILSKFEDNTIYVVTWAGWEHENTLKGMTGIGSYGFEGEEYVGVRDSQIEKLKDFISTIECYSYSIPDAFKKLNLDQGKRFNQGDMFFHDEMGVEKHCSEIGKAEEPLLGRALKAIHEKNEKSD